MTRYADVFTQEMIAFSSRMVRPDLNPMDYTMWDSLSEKVYAGRTEKITEQELKDKIQEKHL
jgi:hypothetical protein